MVVKEKNTKPMEPIHRRILPGKDCWNAVLDSKPPSNRTPFTGVSNKPEEIITSAVIVQKMMVVRNTPSMDTIP